MALRLMIADDHPALRNGVVEFVQGTDIEAVCQAKTCRETVERALAEKPDVLLLDMPCRTATG